MEAATRASLHHAATKFKHWLVELAFHTHKSHGTCPSIFAKNAATLLAADLHPLGDVKIWASNQIVTSIANKIPVTMYDEGCPMEEQPFLSSLNILHNLAPL